MMVCFLFGKKAGVMTRLNRIDQSKPDEQDGIFWWEVFL